MSEKEITFYLSSVVVIVFSMWGSPWRLLCWKLNYGFFFFSSLIVKPPVGLNPHVSQWWVVGVTQVFLNCCTGSVIWNFCNANIIFPRVFFQPSWLCWGLWKGHWKNSLVGVFTLPFSREPWLLLICALNWWSLF